jgi:hypothetical protein
MSHNKGIPVFKKSGFTNCSQEIFLKFVRLLLLGIVFFSAYALYAGDLPVYTVESEDGFDVYAQMGYRQVFVTSFSQEPSITQFPDAPLFQIYSDCGSACWAAFFVDMANEQVSSCFTNFVAIDTNKMRIAVAHCDGLSISAIFDTTLTLSFDLPLNELCSNAITDLSGYFSDDSSFKAIYSPRGKPNQRDTTTLPLDKKIFPH